LGLGILTLASGCKTSEELSVSKNMKLAQTQLKYALRKQVDKTSYPKSINPDGTLKTEAAEDWTSGYFPGSMWEIYAYTKAPMWADSAAAWTTGLEPVKVNTELYNQGIILHSSFGQGLRL